MIRLYVFCSKLEKRLQNTIALELDTWNLEIDMVILQNHKWRSLDYTIGKRRRIESRESISGKSGGGGDNGPLEVDDDWCLNVMKWRDEVVSDEDDNSLDAVSLG
jgi:hypothetical protein